jgi:hypothetical protein
MASHSAPASVMVRLVSYWQTSFAKVDFPFSMFLPIASLVRPQVLAGRVEPVVIYKRNPVLNYLIPLEKLIYLKVFRFKPNRWDK